MIVYIESNFVLELALQQEQAQSAEAILALAESNALRLILPYASTTTRRAGT